MSGLVALGTNAWRGGIFWHCFAAVLGPSSVRRIKTRQRVIQG